jgi:hypothetical protein
MAFDVDGLVALLRRSYPTSHVRVLPEPAMFLRSNTGRTYHAEGMQVLSQDAALAYADAYMRGLRGRIQDAEDHRLDEDHPWIIGVYPGDLHASPLLFIFGNIIRAGSERWVEVGFPRYEKLTF